MSADNTVTLIGNATRDPEQRFTPSGASVVNFGLAVNRRWQNRQTNEWEEEVSFFDVTVWQQLGENVAKSIRKGDRVTVVGRLQQRTWETDNGEKRSKVDVVADDVSLSLRWATVPDVVRNEKPERAPERSEGRGRSDGGGGGRGRSSSARSAPTEEYAEEPF